jgi:hypothetical protein
MAKKLAAKKRTLAKVPKKPGETGRKLLDISEDDVRRLAAIDCTPREMARFFGCDEQTISRRFSSLIEKTRARTYSTLRRRQLEVAIEGHPTMLIWLGKQMLGQAESPVVAIQNNVTNVMSNAERFESWRQTMVQELSLPEGALADD